jgi:Icc-related predicted phosphoesterase
MTKLTTRKLDDLNLTHTQLTQVLKSLEDAIIITCGDIAAKATLGADTRDDERALQRDLQNVRVVRRAIDTHTIELADASDFCDTHTELADEKWSHWMDVNLEGA